jgi:hypothetical protein
MTENNFDLKAAYKIIKMIYFALLAGPLVFMIAALYAADSPAWNAFDMEEPLNIALLVLTITFILAGNFATRSVFKKVTPESDNKERMAIFQKGFIIRMASYEAVALFAIVVFFMTSNLLALAFAVIALLGSARSYPSPGWLRQSVGIRETDLI